MSRTLLAGLFVVAALLSVAAGSVRAQDAPPVVDPSGPTEAELRQARELAARGLEALRAGRSEEAVSLYGQALELAPDERILHYDRAVALERAGRTDEARDAYEAALSGLDDATERSALFNLGALDLDRAGEAEALLRSVVDAEEPAPTEVQAAREAGREALTAGDQAVSRLRDLLRRDPTARDVAHNLEIGQRRRRELRRLLAKLPPPEGSSSPSADPDEQSDQPQEQRPDEPSDGREGASKQQSQPSEQEPQEGEGAAAGGEDEPRPPEPRDPSDQGAEGQDSDTPEEQEQEQAQETSTETGEGEDETREQDAGRDTREEEADRRLDQLLEQARERARKVREVRRERARKTPVERDW